jgi:alpha-L-rhamnosidase
MIKPKQQWIGADASASAPLLRRTFMCERPLAEAVLCICGLGYHEAWINGARVGDHVLDPAQTDYERRVLYVRHDVTALLRKGTNALGVVLGNGWYNQDKVWGTNGFAYGQPRLMTELQLRYADGSSDIVRADDQWLWTPGPITANNVYAGECYDARLEVADWCLPGLDDSGWVKALPMDPPGGELLEQTMPPMRRIDELKPVAIREIKPGLFVVDFGQNFAGWVRIQVSASAGMEIVLRSAETVFPDGMIDTASTGVFATKVEQIDRYICKGQGTETWEPRFTYHGFRYVEVTGWPGPLLPEQVRGIVVHNDLPVAGAFECSDDRLNTLHRMALWTLRSNLHGFPEDCPAREKCGWLGDANLIAEYALWNYDAKSFLEKYLGDIETTRRLNAGIPGNVAPGKRCTRGAAQPDWAAAFIMLPWYLYLYAGDIEVVRDHWQGMTQLMAHLKTECSGWIVPGGHGDFFDPGTEAIVQHTPPPLTSTLWFFRCASVMSAMAEVLGGPDAAAMYREWQSCIAAALKECFFDEASGSFGSQGANVLALAFDVLPDEDARILAALVGDIRSRGNHMNVGVMGVRFILEVLTRRGEGELALVLMRQDAYPSFGHLIRRGATTLWECWGEDEHDRKYGARSLNHPFMGGYDNWFFNTLAGILPDPGNPGFKHFFLEPHPVKGVDSVGCHHDCRYGRIGSNWRIAAGVFIWEVLVPAGTTATATLPFGGGVVELVAGKHVLKDRI